MDALSTALLIGLGGSFGVVWITNIMGARLEAYFQKVSLIWAQWPQRIFMTVGIITFTLVAIDYYSIQTYETDIFDYVENLPLIKGLAEPARWFFRTLGAELGITWGIIMDAPKNTPLIFIITLMIVGWILMSIFDVPLLQKLIAAAVIAITMGFLLQNNFKDNYSNRNRNLDVFDISYNIPQKEERVNPPLYMFKNEKNLL